MRQSFANELGRLFEGAGGHVDGTDTVLFVEKCQVHRDRIKGVTYGYILVDYWPQKEESHRMRLTVGVNLIFNSGYVITPTADIKMANLIINSTISTPEAKCMCYDIKQNLLGNTTDLI